MNAQACTAGTYLRLCLLLPFLLPPLQALLAGIHAAPGVACGLLRDGLEGFRDERRLGRRGGRAGRRLWMFGGGDETQTA